LELPQALQTAVEMITSVVTARRRWAMRGKTRLLLPGLLLDADIIVRDECLD